MAQRRNISSGAKWEDIIGYSRAVQMGNTMEISGTVALYENGIVGNGDFYQQAKFILQKIEKILASGDFSLSDVVRTRM